MYEKVLTKVKETSVLFRERQTDSQLAGLQEQAGECRATEGQKQAEAICLLAKLWGFLAFKMFPFPLASFSFLKHAFDAHSVVSDSVIPWTEACQALLSLELFRQEHWSGLPFPSPGDLPDPGTEPESGFFTAVPPGKPKPVWGSSILKSLPLKQRPLQFCHFSPSFLANTFNWGERRSRGYSLSLP